MFVLFLHLWATVLYIYIKVDAVKKSHEVKALSVISKGKNMDPLQSGKHVRDLHDSELLIPQHITSICKF